MYICICRGITDQDIKDAADQGITSIQELSQSMGVGEDCGACHGHACQVLAAISQRSTTLCAEAQAA
ncbi:MAG: (2Fe-2S)-binding protein [Synechocystis sp.]|jgi:bacterioferritin-associated ferredoxin